MVIIRDVSKESADTIFRVMKKKLPSIWKRQVFPKRRHALTGHIIPYFGQAHFNQSRCESTKSDFRKICVV
jgi:hypothetical protein